MEKLARDEKGYALILVLILLLVGSLIIAPYLAFMSTGLKTGMVYERKTEELYAADAGIEDALWKIMKDPSLPQNVGANWTYNIEDVNDKNVIVAIVLEEDVEGFLGDMLGIKNLTVSPSGHSEWTVITHSVEAGTYTISVSYNGSSANKPIKGVGAWLGGDYTCTDNASGDDDITDTFPIPDDGFKVVPDYKGGTAFIWEWPPGSRPTFQPGDNMTQSFTFTPPVEPEFCISWVDTISEDIGVVHTGGDFGIYKVISTATDNITEEQTEVTSYVLRQGGEVSILTWEISRNRR